MGLFNSDKKLRKEIIKAYNCFKPDVAESIFPGGPNQAEIILRSYCIILKKNIYKVKAKDLFQLLRIYVEIFVRTVATKEDPSTVQKNMLLKYMNIVNASNVRSITGYTMVNISNNAFEVHSESELFIVRTLMDSIMEMDASREENDQIAEDGYDEEDYGLSLDNPVFTNGPLGSKEYLSHLFTESGEPLSWERTMAIHTDKGSIDIYDGTLPSGECYATVYINMYSSSNSQKAPKGLKWI